MSLHNTITDIPGLLVGHAHNAEAITGCTVILCPQGATAGVDQRGGAPGTRETDALHPMHLVQQVHGLVLAGGSAFGLDCAGGVVRYLEQRGFGFDVGVARVPIVPAAILFDLGIGRPNVRPDAEMGFQACLNASTQPPAEGSVGAGMGATVGKCLGMAQAMKAGVGSASIELAPGLRVAALAAVNAFGDVIDPGSGQIVAGARRPLPPTSAGDTPLATARPAGPAAATPAGPAAGQALRLPPESFADTMDVLRQHAQLLRFGVSAPSGDDDYTHSNTVIGVVATNAALSKEDTNKLAQMAQDGLARSIRPAHTMLDGDTIFALSTGQPLDGQPSAPQADVSTLGAFAAEVFAQAVLRAVWAAQSAGGVPSLTELYYTQSLGSSAYAG